MIPIAEDFDAIAAELRKLRCENTAGGLVRREYCRRCEDGGWVERYSQHPPAFQVCPDCYNPDDHPCP